MRCKQWLLVMATMSAAYSTAGSSSTATAYSLSLDNSGPVAIDSLITFTAQLLPMGALQDLKYEWRVDLAKGHTVSEETYGGQLMQLTSVFTALDVTSSGVYNMTVKVYKNRISLLPILWEQLAQAGTEFNLTDGVNTKLTVNQSLPRPTGTLSTHRPVVFTAHVTDHFPNASLSYTFSVDNRSVDANSTAPTYTTVFPSPGGVTVSVDAVANLSSTYSRQGSSQLRLLLKDEVRDVSLPALSCVPLDTLVTANITCRGSAPFSLNWTVSDGLSTVTHSALHRDHCVFPLTYDACRLGNYTLVVLVTNDVSVQRREVFFSVYKPAHRGEAVVAVLAVVCVLVAVAYLIFLWIMLLKFRRRQSVETANFSFESSQGSLGGDILARITPLYEGMKRTVGRVFSVRPSSAVSVSRQEYEPIDDSSNMTV